MSPRCKEDDRFACPASPGRNRKGQSRAIRPQRVRADKRPGVPGSELALKAPDKMPPTRKSPHKKETCFCTREPACPGDWERTIRRNLVVRQPFYPPHSPGRDRKWSGTKNSLWRAFMQDQKRAELKGLRRA